MAEEPHGFTQARARLEDIVSQVRKKDTSLEKSLDLLEEGVRLANQCTELIDHADWEAAAVPAAEGAEQPADESASDSRVSGEAGEPVGDDSEVAENDGADSSADDAETDVE